MAVMLSIRAEDHYFIVQGGCMRPSVPLSHHQPVTTCVATPACLPAEFLDRKELLDAANHVCGGEEVEEGRYGAPIHRRRRVLYVQRDDLTGRHIPVPEAVVKAWVWQVGA